MSSINNEHFLRRLGARNIRNELLIKTDRYMLEDYPLRTEQKQIVKTYRQSLRQFQVINDNHEKNLNGQAQIDFPPQPNFINLNIIY